MIVPQHIDNIDNYIGVQPQIWRWHPYFLGIWGMNNPHACFLFLFFGTLEKLFNYFQALDKKQIIVESAIQQCKDEAAIQVRFFVVRTSAERVIV